MKTLSLDIPTDLDLDVVETKRFLAAKLFESGRLSLGQAAALAGLSKITFSEILADYDVSLVNYTVADIQKDVAKL